MPSKTLTIIAVIAGLGVTAVISLAVLKVFFIGHYVIPQNGMYPSMPEGSRLFANKRAYADPADVKRGDIILFWREEKGARYVYIWRVIALPGETVEASGEALAINGQPFARQKVREADGKTIVQERIGEASYEVALDTAPRYTPPPVSITVPAGMFFVMGDNRFNAVDSRSFGPVPFTSIIGRKL
jgi:signal peptidase I